jgi:hypothetical protein
MVAKAVRADGPLRLRPRRRRSARRASAGETHDFGVGAFLLAGSEVAALSV